MIFVEISGAKAVVRSQSPLTSGMVGAEVTFRFDAHWEKLTKTAVFRCGDVTRDVLLSGERAVIPWETLSAHGLPLEIGVYGTDGDGRAVPTVWAQTNPVCPGADPSGDPSADPALPLWARLEQRVTDHADRLSYMAGQISELGQPAKAITLHLPANLWSGSGQVFAQTAAAELAENTQVNLAPTPAQLRVLAGTGITLVTENDGGALTVYAVGGRPENDLDLTAYTMEVRV